MGGAWFDVIDGPEDIGGVIVDVGGMNFVEEAVQRQIQVGKLLERLEHGRDVGLKCHALELHGDAIDDGIKVRASRHVSHGSYDFVGVRPGGAVELLLYVKRGLMQSLRVLL